MSTMRTVRTDGEMDGWTDTVGDSKDRAYA